MLSLSSHGISAADKLCSMIFSGLPCFTVKSTEDNLAAVA